MRKNYLIFICLMWIFMAGCGDSQKVLSGGEGEQSIEKFDENDVKMMDQKQQYDPNLKVDANLSLTFDYPTFMFHYIEDVPADTDDQMRYNLSYSPEKLEQMLQIIKEDNIETLTFWDIKAIAEGKKEKPEKGVILTFDDGHLSHYTESFRLLEKYNMKGVFFIISSKPDNDGAYANWSQIKEMADAGQEIASHTVNHLNLTTLSDEDLQYELEESKKLIEEKTGVSVISVCYPAGKYDDRVMDESNKYYLFGRTTQPFEIIDWQDRFDIGTVRMFPTTDPSVAE